MVLGLHNGSADLEVWCSHTLVVQIALLNFDLPRKMGIIFPNV